MGTAWLSVFFFLLYYLFGFDPTRNLYRKYGSTENPLQRPNPVDKLIYNIKAAFYKPVAQRFGLPTSWDPEKAQKLDIIFTKVKRASAC